MYSSPPPRKEIACTVAAAAAAAAVSGLVLSQCCGGRRGFNDGIAARSSSCSCTQQASAADGQQQKQQQRRQATDASGVRGAAADEEQRQEEEPVLRGRNLRQITPSTFAPLAWLSALDLSCNELSALPGIEVLTQLAELNISRNWFKVLPPQLAALRRLSSLGACRNFLRPNAETLALLDATQLPALRRLDLRFNRSEMIGNTR
jgi:hypothetical protein